MNGEEKSSAAETEQPPKHMWIAVVVLWLGSAALMFWSDAPWVTQYLLPTAKMFGGFIPALLVTTIAWVIGKGLVKLVKSKITRLTTLLLLLAGTLSACGNTAAADREIAAASDSVAAKLKALAAIAYHHVEDCDELQSRPVRPRSAEGEIRFSPVDTVLYVVRQGGAYTWLGRLTDCSFVYDAMRRSIAVSDLIDGQVYRTESLYAPGPDGRFDLVRLTVYPPPTKPLN